jgi:tetratricopeptide (TPR) repeat protein
MHVLIKDWSAALTLSAVLLVGAGAAHAGDPNAEKARAHFQQGDTYFKLEKYAIALQEFEQAYLAKQDPSFLYNIAQCHRLMGTGSRRSGFTGATSTMRRTRPIAPSPRSTSVTSNPRWARRS